VQHDTFVAPAVLGEAVDGRQVNMAGPADEAAVVAAIEKAPA
jgi:hypothetical protein